MLDDSSFLSSLDPRLARPFLEGFADAMSTVFLAGAAILVVALVVVLFLPELPLRTGSALSERIAEDRAEAESSAASAPSGRVVEAGPDAAAPSTTSTDGGRRDTPPERGHVGAARHRA